MAAGEKSFGFIGAGAMGSALMRESYRDLVKAGSVFASDPDKGRLQEIVAELGINPVKDNGKSWRRLTWWFWRLNPRL